MLLPKNPFDFKTRAADTGVMSAREALISHSDRLQCAVGVDIPTLLDLCALLAEGLGFGGWPEEVLEPLHRKDAVSGAEETQASFGQMSRVFWDLRHALDQHAEAAAGEGGGSSGMKLLEGLSALKGPAVSLTDASALANPLQSMLANVQQGAMTPMAPAGAPAAGRPDICAPWIGDALKDVDPDAIGSAALAVRDQIQEEVVERVVDPLFAVGERLDALLPLSTETRSLIPKWQQSIIALSVGSLREHGFPVRDVDTLISALYYAREGGQLEWKRVCARGESSVRTRRASTRRRPFRSRRIRRRGRRRRRRQSERRSAGGVGCNEAGLTTMMMTMTRRQRRMRRLSAMRMVEGSASRRPFDTTTSR